MSAALWVEIAARTGGQIWDKLESLYCFLSPTCTFFVDVADETGWHFWILLLDLDQPASLFFIYWFCLSLGQLQIQAGLVSVDGRRLKLDFLDTG